MTRTRTPSLWDTSSLSNIDHIPDIRCVPPVIVKRTLDLDSTIPFFDEKGMPKKWTPCRINQAGEWVYSLNPNFHEGPLRGIALMLHLQAIKQIKLDKAKQS